MKKPNPQLTDEENPELTAEDFSQARPAREVYPDLASQSVRRKRVVQKIPGDTPSSIRIGRAITKKG
jgi:hypothetical protein